MRVAHLSDFHLPTKPGKSLNGAHPDANLVEALAVLKKQTPKPDLVVLGGDLLDDGQKGDYEAIAGLFKEYQVPLHTVVGNHDDLKALKKSSLVPDGDRYPGYGSIDQGGLHVVLLNSAGTGKSHGYLDEEQLLWLSGDLSENRDRPVLIFMHHHPIDSAIPWLDKMRLENAAAFWEIIPPYSKNILGIFFAHLHIQIATCARGVLLASPPAVCFQYAADSGANKAEISDEQPGFNLIDVADWSVRLRTVRFAAPSPQQQSGRETASKEEAGSSDPEKS